MQTKEIAIVGVFSALAYAGGYALIFVPNIEIFTALIFLSGLIFGIRVGSLVGGIAAFLYGVLNPYGVSPLPLLAAQVLSRVLVGYAGGMLGRKLKDSRPFWIRSFLYGLTGMGLICVYILFANLGLLVAFGYTMEQLKISIISGLLSSSILILFNALIFSVVLPWVTPLIRQAPYFEKYRIP